MFPKHEAHSTLGLSDSFGDAFLKSSQHDNAASAIITPDQFSEHLEVFRVYLNAEAAGITLVPQEGPQAGQPLPWPHLSDIDDPSARDSVSNQIESLRNGGEIQPTSTEIICRPITGAFVYPIGYVWFLNSSKQESSSTVELFSNSVAAHVEKSKKSRLHEVLSSELPKVLDKEHLFTQISKTITKGLYCDLVIIWTKDEGGFVSQNVGGWDLLSNRNMVGEAFEGRTIVVPSISDWPGKIYFRNELTKKHINSFFLTPLAKENDGTVKSAVGVFYKRAGGTTKVDQELVEYIIAYFKELLDLFELNSKMRAKLDFFDPILALFNEVTECMVELHSLSPALITITDNLRPIVDRLKDGAANYDELSESLEKSILGKRILERHAKTFTRAAAVSDEAKLPPEADRNLAKVECEGLFKSAAAKHKGLLESLDVKLNLEFVNLPGQIRIETVLVDLIFENLISNTYHSLSQKQSGGNSLSINVSLEEKYLKLNFEDTGVGIEPSLVPHVFTKGVTTRRKDGSGVGLALVWSIATHFGREPKVHSVWGHGATFTVWVKPQDMFGADGVRYADNT